MSWFEPAFCSETNQYHLANGGKRKEAFFEVWFKSCCRLEGKWDEGELKRFSTFFVLFLLLDARVGHGKENGVLVPISKKVRFWIVFIF